jgi:hypothetical protein
MTQKLTPMAQLIEDLELLRKTSFTAQEHKLLNDCITLCYAKFNEEKQMVVDAWGEGNLHDIKPTSIEAEQYFNQNYKQ